MLTQMQKNLGILNFETEITEQKNLSTFPQKAIKRFKDYFMKSYFENEKRWEYLDQHRSKKIKLCCQPKPRKRKIKKTPGSFLNSQAGPFIYKITRFADLFFVKIKNLKKCVFEASNPPGDASLLILKFSFDCIGHLKMWVSFF
ncbi:hypothetical protein BpHYR1_009480 [Brachionus plicatilis]|uniref:Uncharacterized protein n=1 Tax=Brachionus plicatilis TaxID=10195 RepID=A0A3M7S0L5_BRAPC|nr:hypothetical protein BpHYR1_009480 [Brachionus plicatilis]